MNTLIHADIFFFVTTIVVVVVGIIFIILLIYAILSIRTLFKISKALQKEADNVIKDVEGLRGDLKQKSAGARAKFRSFRTFFKNLFKRWFSL